MKAFIEGTIDYIIDHYKAILIVLLLITVPMLYYYTQQSYINGIDVYFEKSDPDYSAYKKFKKTFGNEEQVVIAFKAKDVFKPEIIKIIKNISNQLNNDVDGIQRVFSLTLAKEAIGTKETVEFRRYFPENKKITQELCTSVKKRILLDKTVVNQLISQRGTTTAISAELDDLKNIDKKTKVINTIKAIALKAAGKTVQVRFSGAPFVEVEMNRLAKRDNMRFTPFIMLIIFFIVMLNLKKVSLAILCMINLIVILIWGIGFFVFAGNSMNLVTSIIPPVLLAIAVADSIHILSHYKFIYDTNGNDHIAAIKRAAKDVWLPCLFTSLTTGAGFFSFVTSTIKSAKVVGIFTFIGVMFAFIVTLTLLPTSLVFLKKIIHKSKDNSTDDHHKEEKAKKDILFNALHRLGTMTTRNYRVVGILFVLLFLFAVAGMTKITFQTNVTEYLPENLQIRKDIDFIGKNLGGTIPFVILIKAKSEKYDFKNPQSLKLIDEAQKHLMKKMPHFTYAFSISDYFKQINKAFNEGKKKSYEIPKSRVDIIDYYEIGNSEVLDRIISYDKTTARISIQSHWGSNERGVKNSVYIDAYLKKHFGTNYECTRTGLAPLYLTMQNNMRESQMKSFALAFLIIFFMMYLICRNLKLTIISMVPNLFPVVLILGIMGWFGLPIDVSTVMIASIVIGIAVDDTVHFTVWFKRNSLSGLDRASALMRSYYNVGKPIVITSIVLFLGFFLLILGAIKPTKSFGVLTALAMLFALISDLIFYPALILIFKPDMKKGLKKGKDL